MIGRYAPSDSSSLRSSQRKIIRACTIGRWPSLDDRRRYAPPQIVTYLPLSRPSFSEVSERSDRSFVATLLTHSLIETCVYKVGGLVLIVVATLLR